MAVFMLNVCKFNGCGLSFRALGELIRHIEETHIDYDPRVVEQSERQQPACIPLSYALRFLTDAARKDGADSASVPGSAAIHRTRPGRACLPGALASRSMNDTPTGSEAEDGDWDGDGGGEELGSEPEDSNDSWTTSEDLSADLVLRYASRSVNRSVLNPRGTDKPFACPIPGCKKRYKNVNGIKYHSKNGHKNDAKARQWQWQRQWQRQRQRQGAFECRCGKRYKTSYGLKNHASIRHGGSSQALVPDRGSLGTPESRSGNRTEAKVPAIEDHGYIKRENEPGILSLSSVP
ncbi:juxtaposed with another zinc finger protein 1 [Orussus abietinus]|uniref:juxtaposed with another zinc finger protein 1 n=1 Tax=Orussus abietinus TaxID=222816 RepID=UPI0006256FB0|nr:juxtaposed with another zinc finger protein 1 [Orussus abietinus]